MATTPESEQKDSCTLLEKILQTKVKEIAKLKEERFQLGLPLNTVDDCVTMKRRFEESLRNAAKAPVIAEIKRRSPSAGQIAPSDIIDPSLIARQYQIANAACVSVLTDNEYFGGSLDDLKNTSASIDIPIIRKDFIIDEVQILEAKEAGASAVLLIVACLGANTSHFVKLCDIAGIESLVEIHNDQELEVALNSKCRIIGVNTRNLHTFVTDLSIAEVIVKKIPESILKICESGIKSPKDANRILAKGFDAVLIGESLMKSHNVAEFIGSIRRLKTHI